MEVVFLYHFSTKVCSSPNRQLFSLLAYLRLVCTLWTPVERFYTLDHQPCKFIRKKKEVNIREFNYYLIGMVWNTNMVAVSLFWDTSAWLPRCRVKMKRLIQTTCDVFIALPDWKRPAYTGSVDFATSINLIQAISPWPPSPLKRETLSSGPNDKWSKGARARDLVIGLSELYFKLFTWMYPLQKFLFFLFFFMVVANCNTGCYWLEVKPMIAHVVYFFRMIYPVDLSQHERLRTNPQLVAKCEQILCVLMNEQQSQNFFSK